MTKPASHRVSDADIDRAEAISVAVVAVERGLALKRSGGELVGGCPHCGGRDRFAINIAANVFNCRGCSGKGGGAISFLMWLDRCTFPAAVEALTGRTQVARNPGYLGSPEPRTTPEEHDRRQREKALWLWSHRKPITGSVGEVYLREGRGITCPLPPTLAFLPPTKPGHHPAMIAAFGINAPREIIAVHLTKLKPDGSGKAEVEPNKTMIGSPSGRPIIIAPPNDLLGLAITEGIEDALSVHQATGLGAWAAGSAPHLGKLGDAVPGWIDSVTIYTDADADRQGERNAALLAERLNARGIEATIEGLDP
jgi:hypothetical protein